ncbi:hypothetical protein Cgig2_016529 [Carnegiea gigantea]|uniref:Uncharacterized protein n=1 Tax=Carnegiea gigantea TaxID=171969 RepID=A0A9Q1JZ59_9CARY|nr:hypothetical protein Cgig2_016529 [Carnegiea gigantea]
MYLPSVQGCSYLFVLLFILQIGWLPPAWLIQVSTETVASAFPESWDRLVIDGYFLGFPAQGQAPLLTTADREVFVQVIILGKSKVAFAGCRLQVAATAGPSKGSFRHHHFGLILREAVFFHLVCSGCEPSSFASLALDFPPLVCRGCDQLLPLRPSQSELLPSLMK